MNVDIEPSWANKLQEEFDKDYFVSLTAFVRSAYLSNAVHPKHVDLFNAFNLCPFEKVRVVILGQDPYHGIGQAHGLSFSVRKGVSIPPSLKNIFKEIASDVGTLIPTSGNLEHWAEQGVLLLNATLTVESGLPASHQGQGWETFTDAVIKKISDEKEQVVFLLWGKYAQAKASLINSKKHLILTAPHPSPFSAYTGFFGSKHFSQTNAYLKKHGHKPIIW